MDRRLALAGKELIKGNFGNAITALTVKVGSSELIQPSVYRNGNFFFGINGADHAFIWGNYNSSLIAYQRCPVVSSIINRKAQCLTNGKQWVMDSAKNKESKTLQAQQLRQHLLRPNPFQNGRQFRAQNSVYKQIYGYCPVLKIVPVGFETDFSRWRVFNLPPWMVQVLDSAKMFYQDGPRFQSIYLTYMGQSVKLDQNAVSFICENRISTGLYNSNSQSENVSLYLPDSALRSVQDNIDTLITSLNARGALNRERGPMWILSNDQNDNGDSGLFPVDPKEKERLGDEFRMQYGITSGQRRAIITDAKLKLQTVGFDVAQLKLLEGEIQDAKFIADQLNYPPYLLGLVDAKFDNQQIAERNLYTNCIIPDSESDDEQWDEFYGLTKLGLTIDTDFSHLPALQENIAEQGRGRYYMDTALQSEFLNNLITMDRWRELLGEDIVGGELGSLYYYQLLAKGLTFGVVPKSPIEIPGSTEDQNSNNNANN
jgi:phage portal protein BeeE